MGGNCFLEKERFGLWAKSWSKDWAEYFGGNAYPNFFILWWIHQVPQKIVPNIILSLIKAWLSSSETNNLWVTWITLFQLPLFRTSLLLFLLLNNSFVFDAIDYIILQCSVWACNCKITSLSLIVSLIVLAALIVTAGIEECSSMN